MSDIAIKAFAATLRGWATPLLCKLSGVGVLLLMALVIVAGTAKAEDVEPYVIDIGSLQCLTEGVDACSEEEVVEPYAVLYRAGSKCRYNWLDGRAVGARWFDRCEAEFIGSHATVCSVGRDDRLGCGLIDRKGEIVVPLVYDEIRHQEGFSIVAVKYQGLWGYFSMDRERLLLTPQFTEASDFSEGLAYVLLDVEEPEERSWIINDQGLRLAMVPRQIEVKGRFVDGLAPAVLDGKWGYINRYAEWAIQPQFYQVTEFSDGMASVKYQSRPELWSVVDTNGAGIVFFEGGAHRLGQVVNGQAPLSVPCTKDTSSRGFSPCHHYCIDPVGMAGRLPCAKSEPVQ
ncbi:WG repeat-containing protein [Hahella ganghwensis]|uniref:WG repeat-containing protein n=1 Tax=Hahella ganghwensis TaxID=286420 RepID=UPI00035EB793|nr:WG repeat-containing protein [Hahella ganghwensis]